MNLRSLFPKLTNDNHQVASPSTIKYNCVAWAIGVTDRWLQPGSHWPVDSTRDDHGIGNLVIALKSLGFDECEDGTLEEDNLTPSSADQSGDNRIVGGTIRRIVDHCPGVNA